MEFLGHGMQKSSIPLDSDKLKVVVQDYHIFGNGRLGN